MRPSTLPGRKPSIPLALVKALRERRGKRHPPTTRTLSREHGINYSYASRIANGFAYKWVR